MNKPSIFTTVLGTGTCVPTLKRSACSVLLEIDKTKILIDSGPGTTRRLLEAGVYLNELNYIFYSHFHPDHISEMISILFALKYSGLKRNKSLHIIAGTGFLLFYERLKTVFGHWIELDTLILDEMNTFTPDHRAFDSFDVNTIPTNHNPESLSYRFTSKAGSSVVYSGDTDECQNLVNIAKNADLFICESAMPDGHKIAGHLTPSLAGKIASEASVKKLVLTHFYPECITVDIEKQCRHTYSGPLWLAQDLMQLAV